MPNSVNAPMLTEKNDFNVSCHASFTGLEVQSSYAVAENVGIMVNGHYTPYQNLYFAEVGGGYFDDFGKYGVFEIYGGNGLGRIDPSYGTGDYIGRLFIQPGIGVKGKYIEAAFTTRSVCAIISKESNLRFGYFIEPCVVLRGGNEYIKLFAQVGYSFFIDAPGPSFDHSPYLFSYGLRFSINPK